MKKQLPDNYLDQSEKLFMGIDLGTQSIKVIIYDPTEKIIRSETSHPFNINSYPDGTMEQDANWWIAGLNECLENTDPSLKRQVVAIGVSGQQHGFVALDEAGEVLAPVKLWCDTSTEQECNEIMNAVGGREACIDLTGNIIAPGFTASKILWLKKHHPDLYKKLDTILLPHDYINYYLTGIRAMEHGDASGTGLLNVRKKSWSREILQALDKDRDLETCLPKLLAPNDIVGTITSETASNFGFSSDVIVSVGGGDNMMAAIGTGNIEDGQLTASLGTSGTLFAHSDEPIVDKDGLLAAFCSSTGGWLPLLCTMNCTISTEQMRALLNTDLTEMEQLASTIPPGSNGVITVPFYNGERSPDLPNAKATIFGLDIQNTTNAHFLRSAMEASIFGLRAGLESFAKQGMIFNQVTLSGGGSKSALWRQITADILNLPVRVLDASENAAFGAVLQSMWAFSMRIDKSVSLKEIVREHLREDKQKRCLPAEDAVSKYNKHYEKYQMYVDQVASIYR